MFIQQPYLNGFKISNNQERNVKMTNIVSCKD